MKLHPKRDGNPRRFFLVLLLFSLLALGGVVLLAAREDPESLPLLLGILLVDLFLMGALLYWLLGFPQRLFYDLNGPVLTVHHPLGRRTVHRSEVAEVRLLTFALPWWTLQGEVSMPGYHRKRLRLEGLPVEALVGARRGEGVLLVLKNGSGLLLNPEDPFPLLKWKEEA
ncbi:MAG: hypothetical protein ABWJ63_01920 [Thermus sp.]|uniref:Bacterial Pleckstrin homology domain-containing protein n=1 Tax=Thermus brevis TaxID=2862456 RepID=A0ABS6ZW68_9DEIN|nr:hypothetical protein [Thermus brevis]MBW6394118.1 hypothetical protein [Thermus brevis]